MTDLQLPLREPDEEYMTVVFRCNVRKFAGNPFHADTPFGAPVKMSPGDVFSERDDLEDLIAKIQE